MSTPAIPIDASARQVADRVAEKILRPPPDAEQNPALTQLLWDGYSRLGERERLERQNPEHAEGLNFENLTQSLRVRHQSAVSQLSDDLSLPATLLVGDDNPALFSETDRLKAEGELRVTVVPPILALIIAAAISYGWIWVLVIFPLLIITIQGMDREQKSRELMDSAVRQQKISPRSIEDFRSIVESDRIFQL